MKKIFILLFLFFLVFFQLNTYAETNNVCPPNIKSVIDQKLGVMIGKHIIGAEVGVFDGKNICYISYGHTRIGGEAPNPHTVFGIGSITKTMTADLLTLAAQYGIFSNGIRTSIYRDPVNGDQFAKYAGFHLRPAARRITFLELADFTSGLPTDAAKIGPPRAYTYNDFVKFIDSWQPKQHPAAYLYSNAGYALLGHIVTSTLYKSPNSPFRNRYPTYYEAVKALILDPLRMNSTFIYTNNQNLKSRTATHYTHDVMRNTFKDVSIFYREPINPAGAMNSDVADLMLFAQAHLGMNPILGPHNESITIDQKLSDAMKVSTSCYSQRPKNKNICQALGWIIIKYPALGTELTFKNGATIGGYTSFIGLNMDRKMAVVILTNTNNSPNRQHFEIIAHVQNTGLAVLNAMAKLPTVTQKNKGSGLRFGDLR